MHLPPTPPPQPLEEQYSIYGPLCLMIFLFVGNVMMFNLLIALLSSVYEDNRAEAERLFVYELARTVRTHTVSWNYRETRIILPAPLSALPFAVRVVKWALTIAFYPLPAIYLLLKKLWKMSVGDRCAQYLPEWLQPEAMDKKNASAAIKERLDRMEAYRNLLKACLIALLMAPCTCVSVLLIMFVREFVLAIGILGLEQPSVAVRRRDDSNSDGSKRDLAYACKWMLSLPGKFLDMAWNLCRVNYLPANAGLCFFVIYKIVSVPPRPTSKSSFT